jgi:hypothetical protein
MSEPIHGPDVVIALTSMMRCGNCGGPLDYDREPEAWPCANPDCDDFWREARSKERPAVDLSA